MFALLNPRVWVALVLLAALGFTHFTAYRSGKATVRAEWALAREAQAAADLQQAAKNAAETQARLKAQQENQRAQNDELAAARRDAARNARDADQLREQNATVAQQWRNALRNPAAAADREAAADAIGVLADVLGRADRRAGVLASYADAARAAGLKCERDYDALTVRP